ncbi:hypothetical protein [Angelakisella massiliensis]|nr:hypothetical protein [Angelakisella massiliensis]
MVLTKGMLLLAGGIGLVVLGLLLGVVLLVTLGRKRKGIEEAVRREYD